MCFLFEECSQLPIFAGNVFNERTHHHQHLYFHTTSTLMPPSSIRVFLVSLRGFLMLIGILLSFVSYVWCFLEFFQCCSMSLNVSLVLLNVYQCFPNVPSSLSKIIILILIILHISQYFVNVVWHPWGHPNIVRGSLPSWCCLASLACLPMSLR
jgi:hypothetical protein